MAMGRGKHSERTDAMQALITMHTQWGLYWAAARHRFPQYGAAYAHNENMEAMSIMALEALA